MAVPSTRGARARGSPVRVGQRVRGLDLSVLCREKRCVRPSGGGSSHPSVAATSRTTSSAQPQRASRPRRRGCSSAPPCAGPDPRLRAGPPRGRSQPDRRARARIRQASGRRAGRGSPPRRPDPASCPPRRRPRSRRARRRARAVRRRPAAARRPGRAATRRSRLADVHDLAADGHATGRRRATRAEPGAVDDSGARARPRRAGQARMRTARPAPPAAAQPRQVDGHVGDRRREAVALRDALVRRDRVAPPRVLGDGEHDLGAPAHPHPRARDVGEAARDLEAARRPRRHARRAGTRGRGTRSPRPRPRSCGPADRARRRRPRRPPRAGGSRT